MTIGNSDTYVIYNASGTGPYTIPFSFLPNAVRVKIIAVNGNERVPVFTILNNQLTLSVAASSGEKVKIYRDTELTQNLALDDLNSFPAKPTEKQFDKIAMQIQEQKRDIGRALKLPIGASGELVGNFENKLIAIENGVAVPAEKSGITEGDIMSALGFEPSRSFVNFSALRLYNGDAKTAYIYDAANYAAIAGVNRGDFYKDDSDTSSSDDGVDLIVAANGKRWKRVTYSYDINLEDFYAGGKIPYVSPYTSLTYAARQSSPDITSALNAAIAHLTARLTRGRTGKIKFPCGLLTLSATIVVPSGIKLVGHGKELHGEATHLRRTGDYGDTFQFGTVPYTLGSFVGGALLKGFRIYQDHGHNGWGWDNPPAVSFINKATQGVHINIAHPIACKIEDVDTYGLNIGLKIYGSVNTQINNCVFNGIWDLTNSARQETYAGIVIDGSLTTILPTYLVFNDVFVNGPVIYNYDATYPGGGVKSNSSLCIGPQYGVVIKCAEEIYFKRLTVQACAKADILFSTHSSRIIQGVQFIGGTLDPAGIGENDAIIRFENEDAGGQADAISFVGVDSLGQAQSYKLVSDKGSTAANGSVNSFRWVGGQVSTFVGGLFHLENARRVYISGDFKDYNRNNFYSGDAAAGVYLGANVKSAYISGIFGGDTYGNRTGHYCYDAVRSSNAINSNVFVNISDGGLLGSQHVAGGINVEKPPNGVGAVTLFGDANSTLTYGISPEHQMIISPLTAERSLTLSDTDNFGRALKDGARFKIYRNSGGAFNLLIKDGSGSVVATLTGINKWVELIRYSGLWLPTAGNL